MRLLTPDIGVGGGGVITYKYEMSIPDSLTNSGWFVFDINQLHLIGVQWGPILWAIYNVEGTFIVTSASIWHSKGVKRVGLWFWRFVLSERPVMTGVFY